MSTSVTEEPASPASLAPRGVDPSLPADANPEPLPIGIRDMWRLARKTYRAERRYYLKLDRQRAMKSKPLTP